ncbi:MAG TPA: DUF4236 domain-containing protein [Candidatus Binataceae bacterium]|jgi:hypothetical protein|nr:DUF4236 domain-containing protein [Candidatus Binataceae bacterium]
MGSFRFYRRLKIFPGLSVNISKSGPSLSVGVRGAHMTVGRRGIRKSVGIPGTGIYYTSSSGYHTGFHSAHQETPLDPQQQAAQDRRAERIVGIIVLAIVAIALLFVYVAKR